MTTPGMDPGDSGRTGRVAAIRAATRARTAPLTVPLAAAGAALTVAGSLTPWATFFFGYPGKVTLAGFPGGARLYTLLFAVGLLLVVARIAGRRRAVLACALGIVAISVGNLLAIASGGGGLGAVAYGAWLTVAGGVLGALAGDAVREPADSARNLRWGRLWVWAPLEILLIALVLGGLLVAIVIGLKINESSAFVSYLAFLGFAAAAAVALGAGTLVSYVSERHRTVTLAAAAITAAAFPFTQGGDSYWIRVAASIGVFAAAAIGLNIVVGLAGLLDLGYVAFFGVGAYVSALLSNATFTTVHVHVPFGAVIVLGALTSAFFGVIIGAPTLRLRGDYLAIVTLGFGEIFRIVANNWDGLTRGPNGISGVPNINANGFDFGKPHTVFGIVLPGFANYYFLELLLVAGVMVIFANLNRSRIGRAWVAIREDELAARAMGINTVALKLLAFAMGAFLAGAAGTVNAHVTTQVSPDSYTFLESALLLSAVVLGGMGTLPGAVLGSTLLFVIPEKLRTFQDKRLLLFGLALILMMRFRPEGLIANRRRQRELLSEESGADAMSQPGQVARA
jgi:branched-chain amino acid transport system permease protein